MNMNWLSITFIYNAIVIYRMNAYDFVFRIEKEDTYMIYLLHIHSASKYSNDLTPRVQLHVPRCCSGGGRLTGLPRKTHCQYHSNKECRAREERVLLEAKDQPPESLLRASVSHCQFTVHHHLTGEASLIDWLLHWLTVNQRFISNSATEQQSNSNRECRFYFVFSWS